MIIFFLISSSDFFYSNFKFKDWLIIEIFKIKILKWTISRSFWKFDSVDLVFIDISCYQVDISSFIQNFRKNKFPLVHFAFAGSKQVGVAFHFTSLLHSFFFAFILARSNNVHYWGDKVRLREGTKQDLVLDWLVGSFLIPNLYLSSKKVIKI